MGSELQRDADDVMDSENLTRTEKTFTRTDSENSQADDGNGELK